MTIEPEATIMMYFPTTLSVPSTATHFNGDLESPVFFKCTQIGVAGDHWWAYIDGCWRFIGHNKPTWIKSLPKHGPMQIEVCQHGVDITNKPGIACPEGCLSNVQRGKENRQLVDDLAEAMVAIRRLTISETMDEFRTAICDKVDLDVFDSFIAQQVRDIVMQMPFPIPRRD